MLSLNDLCLQINQRFNARIKKQALDQRFNQNTVAFFKKLLHELLAHQLTLNISLESYPFDAIWLKDSTAFQLPESMEASFPGSGGGGSNAAARIQFEMELISGCVHDLSLHSFNEQDISNAKQGLEELSPGALLIRDLGYIDHEQIKKIEEKGAYYINRLPANSNVYEKTTDGNYKKLEFIETDAYLKRHQLQAIEKQVYLGEDKVPTRLIITKIPEEQKQKRLRKANHQARKKGRSVGKQYKARAGLNLFITNLTTDEIYRDEVINFYKLRWQIELVFKAWKSIGHINQVKNMKVERFECLIYAKLIWVMLNWKILSTLNYYFEYYEGLSISYYKGYKHLMLQYFYMRDAIIKGRHAFKTFMEELYHLARQELRREKKKHQTSFMEYLKELKLV